jgi:lipopolysaccharide export system protein LptA
MSSRDKILLMGLLLLSQSSWGLESDRSQPIHIKADRITVNEKQGVSFYQGNVQFTQGSLRVNGDEVTVFLQDDILSKVIVIGSPATLVQQPDHRQEPVNSKARRMEYDAKKEIVYLIENAEVQQGPNRFAGNHIEYDTRNSMVSAHKGEKDDSRVHVIINPPEDNKDKGKTP